MRKKRVSKGGPGQDAGCQATRHGSFKIVSEQCDPDRPWEINQPSKGPTMSIKTLIAMCATVAASIAAPTMVQAAQESRPCKPQRPSPRQAVMPRLTE